MITIENLSKSFGSQQVLRGITCAADTGKIVGLAGPNACGKTTLIKAVLGLVIADSGCVRVGNIPSNDINARRDLGYMPQRADYPERLTPRELFNLVAKLKQRPPTKRDELIEQFGAGDYLDKPCGHLSVGTRQKISAIAAFMCEPRVLILDEPTASFDPLAAFTFKRLVAEQVDRAVTVLIVSHIISELSQLIHNLIFMVDGSIVFNGAVSDLQQLSGTPELELGVIALMKGIGSQPRARI